MLQQTQVATVIDYFNRFIERFPDARALAGANEQEVLNAWQGLGYYRRARNLHRAAQVIVEEFDGRVPDTVEGLLKLPGVGRYTAGAVASIAYGVRAPIVDGNVARVLARIELIDEPVDEAGVKKRLWGLAERYVPGDGPGDFNQAMMELGAMVCVPRGPSCLVCPVKRYCGAHEAGRQGELPVVAKRVKQKKVRHEVVAIEKGGKFLFAQRGGRRAVGGDVGFGVP